MVAESQRQAARIAMTPPLPFTWPYLVVFWTVYGWVFIPEFRFMTRKPSSNEDRGSLYIVGIGFSVGSIAAFLTPSVAPKATLPGQPVVWFIAGLLTLVSGSLLRRHCFRVLGKFFTGAVTIQLNHRIVDAGAYRWLRHPSYTAALLIALGITLSLGNWLSILVILSFTFPAYAYRVHVEEQALTKALGAPYVHFMASRKRFIPFIY